MDLNEGLEDFTGDGSGGGVEEYERFENMECERDGEGEREASQTGEGGEGE